MILLAGASGYVGRAFQTALQRRGWPFAPLSRNQVDYARFDVLLQFLRKTRPLLVINAAGYTGKPNVDACETERAETLLANTLLPQTIAHACEVAGVPLGHVSSGCIYSGAKVMANGQLKVERDLTKTELRFLADANPEAIYGFTETDEANFTFRRPPCSFYSGSKALAEEAISGVERSYIWRLRLPFDEFDNARNYLSKIQRYAKVWNNVNSISHRGDFANACLDLWDRRAPFGIYNVTNPGYVTTRNLVDQIQRQLKPDRRFEFWDNEEFYRIAAKAPRSDCVLDVSKLLSTGVKLRPVDEAVADSLRHWAPE
jgi:dTDP-4-dehydrorhamnose reductase